MSRVCGFKFLSSEAHLATLEGTRASPILVTNQTVPFPQGQLPGQFADWAVTQFELILKRENPDRIVYKLTAGLDKHSQIFGTYFGLCILNLVAHRASIRIRHVVPTSVRPTAFGLARGDSIDKHIQNLFAPVAPPWNGNIREAASIALLDL